MGSWRLDRLLEALTSQQFMMYLVWTGMAGLTIALLIMMRTQWGQSQPLRKCIFLSLLAHLLMGMYAATIGIATSAHGHPGESIMTVHAVETLVAGELDEEPVELDEDEANDAAQEPWDALASSVTAEPKPEQAVERPESEEHPVAQPEAAAAPAIPAEAPLAVEKPLAAPLATAPAAVDAVPIAAALTAKAAATAIEAPTAVKVDAPAPPAPQPDAPQAEIAAQSSPAPPAAAPPDPSDSAAGLLESAPLPPAHDALHTSDGSVAAPAALSGTSGPLEPIRLPTSRMAPQGAVAGASPAPAAPAETYQNRVAPDRAARAQRYGATPQSEAAAQAALRWLAAHQSADGRWDASRYGAGMERQVDGQHRGNAGADADTGVTGLALLAFLAAGNSHQSGDYRDVVDRGLRFLTSSQAADGSLGGQAMNYAFMYCHGMATLAITEAYGMTHDERLRPAVERAVGYTVAAQHPSSGGWRYRPWRERPSDRGDMSQFGWQLMVMRSAELSGVPIPGEAKQALARFLSLVSSGAHGGLASYRPSERATPTMTAEALACRQFMGMRREDAAGNEAADYLMQFTPGTGVRNLYYWYYGTLAMFQLQDNRWQRWNSELQRALIDAQIVAGVQAGSWEPDAQWGGYGGRVYATALGALCLEVYSRYLPLYAENTVATPPEATSPLQR
ncbi:MAG: hypothetical protein K1X74_09180 [Pirellulales bacterium]|nr:hypothetical protein [Pirellulales bacterium]